MPAAQSKIDHRPLDIAHADGPTLTAFLRQNGRHPVGTLSEVKKQARKLTNLLERRTTKQAAELFASLYSLKEAMSVSRFVDFINDWEPN